MLQNIFFHSRFAEAKWSSYNLLSVFMTTLQTLERQQPFHLARKQVAIGAFHLKRLRFSWICWIVIQRKERQELLHTWVDAGVPGGAEDVQHHVAGH